MIKHIPYKPEHALSILNQGAMGFCEATDGEIWTAAEAKLNGEAYTSIQGGRVIACGGCEEMVEGIAQAWFLCVKDIDPMMVKDSKRKFLSIAKRFTRVQAPLRDDFPIGEKFAKFMGFEFEQVLPQFHQDGTDALMYVLGDI